MNIINFNTPFYPLKKEKDLIQCIEQNFN
jgi:hypothetical protein